jgi:hypothetical protein
VADIDDFATTLLEEAKRLLEKAGDAKDEVGRDAYLHASLMLAFCSLEAHVNAIAEEFSDRPEISVHSKGVLLEREVKLEDGEFVLAGFRMSRLEDRILLLMRHFTGKLFDKSVPWWGQLKAATTIRNELTHPKQAQPITSQNVRDALVGIIALLDALYRAIYKKSFPAANRGLHSRLAF